MTPLSANQNMARRWTLISWSLLFGLIVLGQLQHGMTLVAMGWALLFAVPLLASLPGLLRGHRYTYQWATLCVLPYFVVGVTESVANTAWRSWALLLLGASLLWFFALLSFLRVTAPRRAAE